MVYDIISAHNEKKAIVPIELAQIGTDVIVSFNMTQIPNCTICNLMLK